MDLIRCRPEDWPEILATQAGTACSLNVGSLNLLADAAVQVAAMANQFAYESLNDEYTTPWSLRLLATQAGCSPQHLGRGFHAAFCACPMAYLARVRRQHAQWLLADGRRSLSEISTAVGIDDRFCFTRTFHRCFGCSPRACKPFIVHRDRTVIDVLYHQVRSLVVQKCPRHFFTNTHCLYSYAADPAHTYRDSVRNLAESPL